MQLKSKAGLLVVLLIVPALFFLFLVFFGQNKFELPFFLAYSVESDSGILILKKNLHKDKSLFLDQFSSKNSVSEDTLYLKLPSNYLNLPANRIVILFNSESFANPSENQKAELLRINEKIENREDIVLFERYQGDSENEFWTNFISFVKTGESRNYNSEGMIFLFDKDGFCRGLYDPSVKAEVDRLITEYQILQKF